MTQKIWTDEETQQLLELSKTLSHSQVGLQMGRTKDSVRHRLKWLKDKETPQEEKKSPVAAKSVKKKEAHKEKEIRPTRTKEPHVSYPPLEWCPTCHSPVSNKEDHFRRMPSCKGAQFEQNEKY